MGVVLVGADVAIHCFGKLSVRARDSVYPASRLLTCPSRTQLE
jgi:hypothetical protein